MGIDGISFVVVMNKPIENIKDVEPVLITLEKPDGKIVDIPFDIFTEQDYDVNGSIHGDNPDLVKELVVELHSPDNYDDELIPTPTIHDFTHGSVNAFYIKCDDNYVPLKIKDVYLYQNGYYSREPELDEYFSNVIIYHPYKVSSIKYGQVNDELPSLSRDEAVSRLTNTGIWEIDKELLMNYLKPPWKLGKSDYLGAVYFGNYMLSLKAAKTGEEHSSTLELSYELFKPKNCESIIEAMNTAFPETTVSALVDNHISMTPSAKEIINFNEVKNIENFKKSLVEQLFTDGLLDGKDIDTLAGMKDRKLGFFQKFNEKYRTLEQIEYLRADCPVELIRKKRLNLDDIHEIGCYYYELGNLICKDMDLLDRNREVVKEMIKDGLNESKINTVFLDVNRRMNLGMRNNGISTIMREPKIKALLLEKDTKSITSEHSRGTNR